MHIILTTPMSDDKERQQRNETVLDAIERYTEERMNDENTDGSRSGGQPVIKTQHCPNCESQAVEIEALRHDLERQMTIANEHVNEVERLRAEAEARYDRGYYDGFTRPLEQSDALRDQLLRECLVKLRDVQGTEAPKQYACNLIKRIERVLKNQRT